MVRQKLLYLFIALILMMGVNCVKPVPKCQPKFFYRTLPMIPNESAILNLDSLFEGYNLNFQLQNSQEFSKFITLNKKLTLQKKENPDTPMVGLKSYHLQKIGNAWGSSFVAMSERGDRTYLSYGFLASNTSAPVINNDVRVENSTNTKCYDAVIFPKEDVIIVDCAVKFDKPNEEGFYYQNQFHFFRISDGSKLKVIPNQMFVPFKEITRRKMEIYTQKISGNTYLLRAYMFDGVDKDNQANTYIDVHMVTKPLQPWIVSVIDRSFLGSNVLRATDIKVYLSEIYILDWSKGIYRIRINTQEDLINNGFYEAKGFNRFSVYSNNLDDKFELALANDHKVYEIDWSNIEDPILLTKYSLMPDSVVRQVFLNERFVVVLSSAYVASTQYNYTWILSRNDRTYTKAFQVIKHDTSNTFVDLNLDQSFLMVMDDQKIANYAIDQAILTLNLTRDQDFIDRIMSFDIIAKSYQPLSGQTLNCSFKFNFTQLQENNRTMWPIGAEPAPHYNANYPGKVQLPLYSYVIGPNITYRLTEVKKGQLNHTKIYQQDQLDLTWGKKPPLQNLIFLRSETLNHQNKDTLLIYTQDINNKTLISFCNPDHKLKSLQCSADKELTTQGTINNWATTYFLHRGTLQYHHIAAYTTTMHYNKVYVDDVSSSQKILEFYMPKGYEGHVTHVQTYGRYMFIIKRYIKRIQIYDLQMVVQEFDQPICSIDYKMMYNMGVKYFSPQLVQTSEFYPNVLFIKTSDSIIVLDLNTECQPKLLAELKPVENTLVVFSFMLTASHLVVTAMPNSIIQYDLSRVYLKDIKKTKGYPIYGYKLPKNYDTDVSEYGNLMFVTTVSEGGDYQVFVYRAGHPGVAALYDVIDLYTYEPILIDASGNKIDYITVYSNNEIRIFREYETPLAEIENPSEDYELYLEYYNVATSIKLELISVSIINLPTNITVNPVLDDIMKTKDLLFSGYRKISQINDTDWYDGNVITIKTDCRDCSSKVTVRNHIHKETQMSLVPFAMDYQWNWQGGVMQVRDSLWAFHNDGDIRSIAHMPQISSSVCLYSSLQPSSKYMVSACLEGRGVNLYLSTLNSQKVFVFQPYSSRAEQISHIQMCQELIIVVDSSTDPFHKTRSGGVIIYALNTDFDEDVPFQELQYIESSDLTSDDRQMYIVSADLSYHRETDTYRLYVSELTEGVFSITFKYLSNTKGISILHTTKIDLPQMLSQSGHMAPYDATYQGVKNVRSSYDKDLEKTKDTVLVTMGVYHTIVLQIIYDVTFVAIDLKISKFLLRYAYYVVEPDVKTVEGLLVLRQVLPQQYDKSPNPPSSKQILTVYDIDSMPFNTSEKIPEVGLMGAFALEHRNRCGYNFNLTINYSDPHPVPRINLALLHESNGVVEQLSLHRNLTVYTEETVDTQIIYLDLINDFDIKKIRILLNGYAPFPQWKLIMIILFSIVGFIILMGVSFIAFKKYQAYKSNYQPQNEQSEADVGRASLLTDQKASTQRYSGYSDYDRQESFGAKSYSPSYDNNYGSSNKSSSSSNVYPSSTQEKKYDDPYSYTSKKYDDPYSSSSKKYDDPYSSSSKRYDDPYEKKYDDPYSKKYDDPYSKKYDDPYSSTSKKYDDPYSSSSKKYDDPYSSKYDSKKENKYQSKYDNKYDDTSFSYS